MFSIARRSTARVCNPLVRGFAQAAPEIQSTDRVSPPTPSQGDAWKRGKVPVNEAHGLYGFFRRKPDENLSGEDAYNTVESQRQMLSGRAWKATELRLKSFQDLHTLWYVTLRERNLLATQREEARRMGIKIQLQAQSHLAQACRKTMARIKAVMNERRLAYEGAIELFEDQKEQIEDKKLLKMQREALTQAEQKLVAFTARNKLLRREKRRALAEGRKALEKETQLTAASTKATESTESTSSSSTVKTAETEIVEAAQPAERSIPEPAATPAPEAPVSPEPEAPSRPQTAAETASAGLFGDVPRK